jgi:hypothetical protein
MKPELREEIIQRTEQAFIEAGASSYDDGTLKFGKVLNFVNTQFVLVRTKEQFRSFLNEVPQPSLLNKRCVLGTLKYLPQILRFAFKSLSEIAEVTLPKIPTGKPGMELQMKIRIVDVVGNLHKRKTSLDQCMKIAAERFCVSKATVQRAWDDRTSLDDADFRSCLKYLTDGSA